MITDVLFGIKHEDMEEIRELLEDILDRELEARESLHKGGYTIASAHLRIFCICKTTRILKMGRQLKTSFPNILLFSI